MIRPISSLSSDLGRRAAVLISIVMLAAALVFTASGASHAAPSAKLWDRWTTHDAASSAMIDHSAWDRFLKKYISEHSDGVNRVAYGRVSRADRRALETYIRTLMDTRISTFSRDEQLT